MPIATAGDILLSSDTTGHPAAKSVKVGKEALKPFDTYSEA